MAKDLQLSSTWFTTLMMATLLLCCNFDRKKIKDKLAELSAEGCKAEKGDPLPVGEVDMRELRQGAHRYFRYVGSLTAPPCTESVIWNILGEMREMTRSRLLL